ncbi:Crp/Fnr family transcriptional regulator [Microvirga brassicacearum]|uniref:Crp/Fnr family transcriptional regulator n=1 Tax=Microvirga brassicacearum TaxID=2580413 RepID=A0A5N3PAV8_9HYPH|nr:Crp/Fnr family transcriptional regulator [Microvirga brassicacearum]KAB0266821.1 Crp/Fnr family transcriptional regulator [Microvirga brassicacearum]
MDPLIVASAGRDAEPSSSFSDTPAQEALGVRTGLGRMSDAVSIRLLNGLEPDVAAELLGQAQRRVVRADEVLFTAGQPARSVHVLTSGTARLVQTAPNGARVIIKYVRSGEIFGSPALLDRFYPVDAVAVTECVELQWSSEFVRAVIDRHPRVALNVIHDLETRLREMENRLRDLSNEPVEHRLARAILKLVETFGQETLEGIEIPFPVSRQDLADLIGSTLPTVSRTLRAWEAQRQIRRYRRRLVIADVEAVARVLYKETPLDPKPRRSNRRATRR